MDPYKLGRLRGVSRGTSDRVGARRSGDESDWSAWRTRLAGEVRKREIRARAWPWLTAAAGFAAGMVLMLSIEPQHEPVREPTAYASFKRTTPPPLASAAGSLARLGTYLQR